MIVNKNPLILLNTNISKEMPYLPKIAILLVLLTISYSQFCLVPNCQNCPSPYICNDCPAGQQCCQQSCANCVNQTQCQGCSVSYTLNSSSGICQLTQPCLQQTCSNCTNSQCQACMAGYVYNTYTY